MKCWSELFAWPATRATWSWTRWPEVVRPWRLPPERVGASSASRSVQRRRNWPAPGCGPSACWRNAGMSETTPPLADWLIAEAAQRDILLDGDQEFRLLRLADQAAIGQHL